MKSEARHPAQASELPWLPVPPGVLAKGSSSLRRATEGLAG